MTDDFLQKLEEKIMILLAELEDLRFEVRQLKKENSSLKEKTSNYTKKLQGLIALLNSVEVGASASAALSMDAGELEAMQRPEEEEYAAI